MKKHQTRIQEEFSRQAETLSSAPVFTNEQALIRIREAAHLIQHELVLDLACGPGIVTEALAYEAGNVIACDITPAMLTQTQHRCIRAGLTNVHCVLGQAEQLPFDDGTFDVIVSRSAVHHFPQPDIVFVEIERILRPSGRCVLSDVVSSEKSEDSILHNALELLRDPSHTQMLPESKLLAHLQAAGLKVQDTAKWTNKREFEEWLRITNAPERVGPLRVVMATLAKSGVTAGINLHLDNGKLNFEHSSLLLVAVK
ncbi:MAG: class I SAM-dependent methyltransferase [Candidatus Binatia bacterium]